MESPASMRSWNPGGADSGVVGDVATPAFYARARETLGFHAMARLHCITHVDFEGPGSIELWATNRGHSIAFTHQHTGDPLPSLDSFDLLVVMGGPMCTRDVDDFPWLAAERDFMLEACNAGKGVLGICLGAQLLAEALGASVTRNSCKEIGWWPVDLTDAARELALFANWPESVEPYHWHGDTFGIPDGALPIGSSRACAHQGFVVEDGRIVGLQFHPELSLPQIQEIVDRSSAETYASEWCQLPEQFLANSTAAQNIVDPWFGFLDAFATVGVPA
jgi:GMP synthase (glutamine-hydrolysing)